MKPSLQLRLGQSLTLTPQLRQAIRLLQLSSIELEAEITQALESNPLLELPDDRFESPAEVEAASADGPPSDVGGEAAEAAADVPEEASYETTLEQDWETPASAGSAPEHDREPVDADGEDLIDHLLWQLNLTRLSERDRRIGVALIDAIDEDGYLREPVESIAAALRPDIEASVEEIESMRHRLQHFDPLGVASRSLAECLGVQLAALSADTPGRALAQRVAASELESLARHGADALARQLGVAPEAMQEAVELLRSLDPKPGAQLASPSVEYVAPDAYAFRQGGRWDVRLASSSTPRLGINRHYESLIGSAGRADASYLRGQLQEARWLIRSLETRADTLLKVARAIVRHQSAFLDMGPEAMRPLVLREIADDVGLHESTVSRVTTRKYLHTPRGTFEFKHFFSSSLATVDGGAASSTAIQAMLKRLIDAENPRRPLSDAALAEALKGQGVTVARRTVAKYREAMNIPSSNERQRLG